MKREEKEEEAAAGEEKRLIHDLQILHFSHHLLLKQRELHDEE